MTSDMLFASGDGPASPRRHHLIVVRGVARTQGSTDAFAIKGKAGADGNRAYTGRVGYRPGRTKAAEAEFHSWRNDIAQAAEAMLAGLPPIEGPVGLRVTFTLGRPQSHFTTSRGRPTGVLKPWAVEAVPDSGKDWDKLARAVGDSLQAGGIYRNDSQVAIGLVFKAFTQPGQPVISDDYPWLLPLDPDPDALATPGAVIRVWQLGT